MANDLAASTIELALDTIKKKKQALIFVNSKRSAEKVAEDIAKKIVERNIIYEDLADTAENTLAKPTKQCQRLAKCLKKGIAFHHSGLHSKQKELIEDEFRLGSVKIIACTPTLAAGLDLPAFRVVIRDLKRFGGNWGMTNIPVLEYLQMAGRAGRPGKEDFGEAITIAKDDVEFESIHENYVQGEPENIYSKLAVEPVLRTYALSLIASEIVRTNKTIKDFFEKTFWAKQFQDMQKLHGIIDKVIKLLLDYKFIEILDSKDNKNNSQKKNNTDTDFVSGMDLLSQSKTDTKYKATNIGKRVAELYLDPLTAHELINRLNIANDHLSNEKEILPFSLLHMISNTLEMRPLVSVKKKDLDIIDETLTKYDTDFLEDKPTFYDLEYEEFLNSINTALFFLDWIDEKDEQYIMNQYGVRPGEIRYKLERAEWLFYACEEFTRIFEYKDLEKEIKKIAFRVKNGVKEEILSLLRLAKIGRVRARKMYDNNIKNIKDVKATDITTLSSLIGKKIAYSVKSELNQDVPEPVKETKRKGQMSLLKFN